MNVLIVFSEPLYLPAYKNQTIETYGLVLNKDHWEPSPYKEAFLLYIRVLSEMFKAGFKSIDGLELQKDGEFFYYGDLTCLPFETKVEESGVRYAIVGEWSGLEESDYNDELFTNKEKWGELVEQADLEWRR